MTRTDTFFSFLCGGCGGGGGGYEKLELVMGGFEKNEGKVWGVHIIPVGNILNSSEPPRP